MLDLAGLGESPLVVRVHRCYKCFAVGVCRLGCFEEAGDSCFVKGCRKHLTVLAVAYIDCKVVVGLVIDMEYSAGRRSSFVGLAVKEGKLGFAGCKLAWERESWRRSSKGDLRRTGLVDHNYFEANCIAQQLDQRMMGLVGRSYPVTACVGRGDRDDDRDVHLEDQQRTDSVVGRKDSAKLESAVHKVVRLSRIGCPDHIVMIQRSLEHFRCSSVQELPTLFALPAPAVHAVH